MLSGGISRPATLDDTATQVAMPLSTPPTIDGIIEGPEWQEAGATPVERIRTGESHLMTWQKTLFVEELTDTDGWTAGTGGFWDSHLGGI